LFEKTLHWNLKEAKTFPFTQWRNWRGVGGWRQGANAPLAAGFFASAAISSRALHKFF